jgi:flagellar motor switch protein FliG
VLERVAEGLREKARHISEAGGVDGSASLDGRGVLAAILKHADMSFEDRILNELEERQPDLGRELKERLYTLDDVVRADDKSVQEKLRSMADRDIAMLIKGRSPEFIEKILANMTANRRAQIRDEREILGAVLKRDSDAVAQEFLVWFREGRENGLILLSDDEDVVL